MTLSTGIFQSDVIIKSALTSALDDIRTNPWLLDYVFISLAQDAVTASKYGVKEMARAKEWFLATKIPVFLAGIMDNPKFPCVTIALVDSSPSEETLSDQHHDPSEYVDGERPALTDPFSVVSYDNQTGDVTIPASTGEGLNLSASMVLVDNAGKEHQILEVWDETSFAIEPGANADFSRAVLKTLGNTYRIALESIVYKESLSLGCHVQGEPVHLLYLHAIIVFCLFRYKQSLLEARGFERSTFSSSDFSRTPVFDPETVFSRYISLSGYARQMWPKSIDPVLQSVTTQLHVQGAGESFPSEEAGTRLWAGEGDVFTE